jgi:hypothetical protein
MIISLVAFITVFYTYGAIPPQSYSLEAILKNSQEESVAMLKKMGPSTQKQLENLAFNGSEPMERRWKSVMLLTLTQGKESLPIIKKALADKEWFMRSAGLTALQKIDQDVAKKMAFEKLKMDPALMVRMKALEILRHQPNAQTRQLFWSKLSSKDSFHQNKSLWIRRDIALELARQPQQKDLNKWVSLLHESEPEMQAIASRALAKIDQSSAEKSELSVSYWREKYPKNQSL